MFFIIGIVIIFSSIAAGCYVMKLEEFIFLWPNELIIILGASIGISLISNPICSIIQALKATKYLIQGRPPYDKKDYLELLLFSFNIFKLIKIKGIIEIESHIENPRESELFKQAPSLTKEQLVLDYVIDNLRLLTMGLEDKPSEFKDILEREAGLYKENNNIAGKVFQEFGVSLFAIAVLIALLGVIIAGLSVAQPRASLGPFISASLVGTFATILLASGVFIPIGRFLHKYLKHKMQYIDCIKSGFIAYLHGNSPIIIVELMRKNIPSHVRPSFEEVDTYINENSLKIIE